MADLRRLAGVTGIPANRLMQAAEFAEASGNAALAAAIRSGTASAADVQRATRDAFLQSRGIKPSAPPAGLYDPPAVRDAPSISPAADQLPLDRRLDVDPNVRGTVQENMPSISQADPDLAARITAGEPGSTAEGYRSLAETPPRSMEDSLLGRLTGESMPSSYEMIPFGTGGSGVPVGGPTGSGVAVPGPTGLSTQVTPRPRLTGSGPRRIGTTAGVPVSPRRLEYRDTELEEFLRSGGRVVDEARPAPRGLLTPRNVGIGAAAAAGAGGAYLAMQPGGQSTSAGQKPERELVPDITRKPKPMSTADLAAETSPPPSISTQEEPPIAPSSREQALALQKDLNERRRRAGGEVPEAQEMRREIQRLYDLADKETNSRVRSGTLPAPSGNGDYRGQARQILAELNAGRIPPAQRQAAQARMNGLYRKADEQDNARTTAYPRSA